MLDNIYFLQLFEFAGERQTNPTILKLFEIMQ